MAWDRFVYFDKDLVPEEVGKALEDYLGGLATSIVWDQDRFIVTLNGEASYPFKRIESSPLFRMSGERWIEVWVRAGTLDVITRQADEATSVLATGFAELCARYWKGKVEKQ